MQRKKVLTTILAVALLVAALIVPGGKVHAAENGMVRVYLSSMNYYGAISDVTVTLNGSYAVESRPEIVLSNRGSYYIQLMNGTIYLSGTGIDAPIDMGSSFRIKQYTDDSGKIGTMSFYNPRYGTRSYRGDMNFDISSGALRLINTVYIEDYLYGVLAGELSNTFPLECLKAQAIIARSYVYNRMIGREPNYEINDTSSDQVYKGYNSSNDVIMRAVDGTAGMLLKYGSSYVNAYFGSSNGGQTELPRNAWSSSAASLGCYVMKDDPYDLRNPSSRIAYYSFTSDPASFGSSFYSIVQSKLFSATGMDVLPTMVNSVTLENPVTTDPASVGVSRNYRTMRMNVSHTGGSSTDITIDLHNELKYTLFGADSDLRLFALTNNANSYTLSLSRYGHGVGMSQRGAQQMANEGHDYRDIINFYFNGVTLEQKSFAREGATANAVNVSKPSIATGSVNASSLLVRSSASTSASKLGSLSRGTKVSITAALEDWYEINYAAGVGYVSAQYILLDSIIPTQTDSTAPAPAESIGTAVVQLSVSSSTLNMRSAPSGSASLVSRLANGTNLTVLDVTDNKWYKVLAPNGLTGYVSGDYVKFTPKADASTPNADPTEPAQTETPAADAKPGTAATRTGIVSLSSNSSGLNVRSGNSSSSPSLGLLKNGDTVTILEDASGWYKIKYGTGIGYVSMGYIKNVQSAPQSTQDPVSDKPAASAPAPSSGTAGSLTDADIPDGGVRGSVKTAPGTTLTIYAGDSSSSIVGYLDNGSGVTVLGVAGDMYFISSDAGSKGFVLKDYIVTATGSASTVSGGSDGSSSGTTQPADAVSGFAKGTIKLSSDSTTLRLRRQPNTSSDIITTMRNGAEIEIMGESGDWYNIIFQDYKGYVMKSYVKPAASTSGQNQGSTSTSEQSGLPAGDITVYLSNVALSSGSGNVNVRSAPSSSGKVIGQFQHGKEVYVIATNGDWYKVVYGDAYGYILKSYLKLSGKSAQLSSGKLQATDNSSSGQSTSSGDSSLIGKSAAIRLSSSSSSLNVRSGPGTDYSVAFTAKSGTQLKIRSVSDGWYGVEINGKTGYVSSKYVVFEQGGSSSSSDASTAATATTTAALNLRASASSSGEKLGTYSKGTTVIVLEKGDSWSKVKVGSKSGYMNNGFLKFS